MTITDPRLFKKGPRKGRLIVIEGPDGIGKTTTVNDIKKAFQDFEDDRPMDDDLKQLINDINLTYDGVVFTQEPGGTPLGQKIRNILLNSDEKINMNTQTLLFLADRAQHLSQVIIPAIQQGKLVICDRFVLSSLVYQSKFKKDWLERLSYDDVVIKKLEDQWNQIIQLNQYVLKGLVPDMTLYFRCDLETAYKRINGRAESDQNDKAVKDKEKLNELLNKYAYVRRFLQRRLNMRYISKDLIDIDANQEELPRMIDVLEGINEITGLI